MYTYIDMCIAQQKNETFCMHCKSTKCKILHLQLRPQNEHIQQVELQQQIQS